MDREARMPVKGVGNEGVEVVNSHIKWEKRSYVGAEVGKGNW